MARNLPRAICATLFVLVACAALGAGVAGATGLQRDVVIGAFRVTFPNYPAPGQSTSEVFAVAASSGPNGQDPKGLLTFASPLLADRIVFANVTCMVVNGKNARVGGMFRKPVTYAGLAFRWFELLVDDKDPAADTMSAVAYVDAPQPPGFTPCAQSPPTVFSFDVGNVKVIDG